MANGKQIFLLSSAIAPLQSGKMGGVKTSLISFAKAVRNLGHEVSILAPLESENWDGFRIIPLPGNLQETLQHSADLNLYSIPANSFLQNAFEFLQTQTPQCDAVVNFSNDWLPYFMTPYLKTPVLHFSSIGDANGVVTQIVQKTARRYPKRVACLSRSHAKQLLLQDDCFLLGQAIDCSDIPFYPRSASNGVFCYFGRISPEKGVEHAAEVAKRSGAKLKLIGFIEESEYFTQLIAKFGDTIDYRGFLSFAELTHELADCYCVLHFHTLGETFGLAILEAMAMGLPVIASDLGAPAEVITHGQTGFLVDVANPVESALNVLNQIEKLDRVAIRKAVEKNYSMVEFTQKCKNWLQSNNVI